MCHIFMRSSLKFKMASFDIHIKVIGSLCRCDHSFELFDQVFNHDRLRGLIDLTYNANFKTLSDQPE